MNKPDILSRIGHPLGSICWGAAEALSSVSDEVNDFKRRLKQTDQKECKI